MSKSKLISTCHVTNISFQEALDWIEAWQHFFPGLTHDEVCGQLAHFIAKIGEMPLNPDFLTVFDKANCAIKNIEPLQSIDPRLLLELAIAANYRDLSIAGALQSVQNRYSKKPEKSVEQCAQDILRFIRHYQHLPIPK